MATEGFSPPHSSLLSLPFLPYPAGEGYARLWGIGALDRVSLGPALALLAIGIAFSAGALVAPDARRGVRT